MNYKKITHKNIFSDNVDTRRRVALKGWLTPEQFSTMLKDPDVFVRRRISDRKDLPLCLFETALLDPDWEVRGNLALNFKHILTDEQLQRLDQDHNILLRSWFRAGDT